MVAEFTVSSEATGATRSDGGGNCGDVAVLGVPVNSDGGACRKPMWAGGASGKDGGQQRRGVGGKVRLWLQHPGELGST